MDILYLHNSDSQEDFDGLMKPGGLLDMAIRFQREGKARFIGFSGHNTAISQQAVESGHIDVLMFPLNFTSHAMPGRPKLLEACVAHQVGLVVMKPFAGGNLLREERSYAAILPDFEEYKTGQCIHCNHCLPCPSNIDIGQVLLLLQMARQGQKSEAQTAYSALITNAADCIRCGECMDRCPFGVDDISQMEEAVGVFG